MKVVALLVILQVRVISGSLNSCIHGGTKYKDGDFFPLNGTIIKTDDPQQCVQCRCQKELVVCEIEKCPRLNCETPLQQPEYCCRRCPEFAEGSTHLSKFFLETQDEKRRRGCKSNGRYYSEGSTWQPVIGPFGMMSCVQCHCRKGAIGCERFQCKDLPCSRPRKEFGKCCPVCPNSVESFEGIKADCLPKTSELFIFKTPKSLEGLSVLEYAFVEGKLRRGGARLHTWSVRSNGSGYLTVKSISHEDFLNRNVELLGATNYSRFRKYSKREEMLRLNCFTHCAKKILQLERTLKVYPSRVRNKCNEDELDAAHIRNITGRG